MSGVGSKISCGSDLGEIVTKLVQIWTCVVIHVAHEASIQRELSDESVPFDDTLRKHVTDGALSAIRKKV